MVRFRYSGKVLLSSGVALKVGSSRSQSLRRSAMFLVSSLREYSMISQTLLEQLICTPIDKTSDVSKVLASGPAPTPERTMAQTAATKPGTYI